MRNKKPRKEFCEQCGYSFQPIRYSPTVRVKLGNSQTIYCSRVCGGFARRKRRESFITKHGYDITYKPDHRLCNHRGYVKKHRLFMDELLGGTLGNDEVVHHINGDKADNNINNLMCISNSAHVKIHHRQGDIHCA
jgi:hypothetical protein